MYEFHFTREQLHDLLAEMNPCISIDHAHRATFVDSYGVR